MNSDYSTLVTFAWAGAVLAGVLLFAVGVVVGVMLQQWMSAPADVPAVAGYGRAEVQPPAEPVVDASSEPAPDPQAHRKAVALAKAAVVDRLASMRADRSQGWDAPGALDELRAVTRAAGRHAKPDGVAS